MGLLERTRGCRIGNSNWQTQDSKESMTPPEPTVLQSLSNPTVRRLVRMRDNRARRRAAVVLVDGWRETLRAIESGIELRSVYAVEAESATDSQTSGNVDRQNERAEVLAHARKSGTWQPVSPNVLRKISYGQSDRGVVAEFTMPSRTLDSLDLPNAPIVLVLDQIEKPGNVGAVLRCADAAKIDAVILSDCKCDLFNPNTIRSSLGAVFTLPCASESSSSVESFLIKNEIRPLAARVESSSDLWSTDFAGSVAIILGNEANGLANRWQMLGEKPINGVRIPMQGQVDSLNISVAAAVIAFEAIRLRRNVN